MNRKRRARPAPGHAGSKFDRPAVRELGKLLGAYLRDRARVESVGYDLTPEFFIAGLLHDCRSFLGIEICAHSKLLRDHQEPEPGYFARWMTEHGHTHCKKEHPAPPKPSMDQLSEHWRAAADNFTDEALLAKWDMVGERMAREDPLEFTIMLAQLVNVAKPETSPASISEWKRFGRVLIVRDRRALCELSICNHLFIDRDRKRAGVGARTETP
jgi:hypothetical protein